MPPSPETAARSINSARLITIHRAAAKGSTPAATRAVYSPRLWPAAAWQVKPHSCTTLRKAMLAVKIAGWVYLVRVQDLRRPLCAKLQQLVSANLPCLFEYFGRHPVAPCEFNNHTHILGPLPRKNESQPWC